MGKFEKLLSINGVNRIMRVVVAGGKLQGVEASYLAREAGWDVVLLDKNPSSPATGLCDIYCQVDLAAIEHLPLEVGKVDLIIPAVEDAAVLERMQYLSQKSGVPLAFDSEPYYITSSKRKSDLLFAQWGIPTPRPWPQSDFPVVMKPSGASGSFGVRRINDEVEYLSFLERYGFESYDWVVQEYLTGPSFSVEVIGCKGSYRVIQTTRLEMDEGHDCKRVLAPAGTSPEEDICFKNTASNIAENLGLRGIMDVEAILDCGAFKILEIDARLPSQTPTAVYKSTGINMLKILADVYISGEPPKLPRSFQEKGVVYEHIRVSPGMMEVCGEHIMAAAGPLRLYRDFFGSEQTLTSYQSGSAQWVATLIFTGENLNEAWERRCAAISKIERYFSLDFYRDSFPEGNNPFFSQGYGT